MAQVGGVRIPFVVDMSDIPRSVKQVEKNLKKLRKTVGDIDLYIDGTKIDQLNRKTLIPVVENFYELEERAKRAALAIQDIGRAANALRTGKVLSDNFVHSLSQISQVGPATQKAVKSYNLLLKELKLLENQSARSTRKMKVYQTAIRDLGQRKIVGLPYTKVFGEGEKDTAEIPATRLAAQMQAMGMGKEAYQSLRKYEAAYRKLDETRKVGGKRHRAQIAIVNNLRERTIRLLAQEWQQAKKLKTEVTDKQIAQVQTEVNKRRERAIDLLRKAELANKKRLDASKQEVTIVAQPKVTEAKRKEIAYWKEQLRIYDALLLKHKLKTISDRERIALQKQAVIMSKKEGWEDDKRLKLRQRLTREIEIQARIQRLQQLQKKVELQHEKWLTQEEKKQLELEKKRRGLRERFPGGGLFSASRVTWFVQLRAFWEIYRIVGKAFSDLVDLDEAVARAMRTMSSDTKSYGQVAEQVHNTIVRTASETGATYRDVGEALYQLSSAGLTAKESLAAVSSVMRLTRTTEAEVTDATKVVAGVFNNFKETLGTITNDTEAFNKISATLSYVWERNQVDMNEMVQALNQAAQASSLAGTSFTELAIVIGNLGTMMIRSGRAGRSIRTAIIQMAAKGQQLAKVFDFTFDPTQPLNFMRTMDKMHESWERMSKSAVVAEKVFQIFGRRGAPAIIALLKNWEKVREEIAGAGNDLQLLINQQEKLLRLQERFRQVSETVWKEIMQLVVEYSNVVKALGITLHNYLRGLRLERAIAEAEKSAGELIEIYGDAGKLTEQAAYAFALLKISQEKQAEALAKGIPWWKKALRYMAAMNLETGKMDEVQTAGYEKEIKALKEHAEQLWLSASLQKTLETYYADAQAVKEEATKVIYSEAESWIMLGRELKKHRALRGELVYTEIELQNVMDREVTELQGLQSAWVAMNKAQSGNKELMESTTKAMTEQSDKVKKLSALLLKLHQQQMKSMEKELKDKEELADVDEKYYVKYSQAVAKRTGKTENLEIRALEKEKGKMALREEFLEAQRQHTDRRLRDLDDIKGKEGELSASQAKTYNALKTDLGKYEHGIAKVKRELEGMSAVLDQMYKARGASVREKDPYSVISEATAKILEEPGILKQKYEQVEKDRERLRAARELEANYYANYLDTFAAQEGRESRIEAGRIARQIKAAKLERQFLKERMAETITLGNAARLAREEAQYQMLPKKAAEAAAMEEEQKIIFDSLYEQRKLLEDQIAMLKLSLSDLLSEEVKFLESYNIRNKREERAQKRALSLLKLRQEYIDETEISDKWTTRESVRDLDNKIEVLKLEEAQRQKNLEEAKALEKVLAGLAAKARLPAEARDTWTDLKNRIKDLEIESELAGDKLGYLTAQRPGTEFLADLSYLDKLKDQQEKEQQHELRMFDIRTAYKEKYQTFFTLWTSKEELQERERLKTQRERMKIEISNMKERRDKVIEKISEIQSALDATQDPAMRGQLASQLRQYSEEYADLEYGIIERGTQLKALQKTKTEMANQNIRNLMAEGKAVESAKLTWAVYGDTIQNYTGQMATAWRDMFAEMGKTNKDAWDIYKGIAIAQAIVDTIKTAQAGAAALAGIPFIGPALATAWVATSIAQGMFRVRQIETTRPQGYAQGGVTYGELKMLDKRRARSASYATGGITSGPTLAAVGDNPSGREIILPEEHIKDDYVGPAYRREKGGEPLNIINLVTDKSIAAAMMRQPGKNVIINAIGEDLQNKKSTYKQVRGMRRSR